MEIDGTNTNVSLISNINKVTESGKQDSAKTTETAQQAGSGDKVELSAQAKEANRAFAQLKELPEIREKKVGEIKNSVETGTYNVDGGKIAVSMLNESLENNAILNAIDLEV